MNRKPRLFYYSHIDKNEIDAEERYFMYREILFSTVTYDKNSYSYEIALNITSEYEFKHKYIIESWFPETLISEPFIIWLERTFDDIINQIVESELYQLKNYIGSIEGNGTHDGYDRFRLLLGFFDDYIYTKKKENQPFIKKTE